MQLNSRRSSRGPTLLLDDGYHHRISSAGGGGGEGVALHHFGGRFQLRLSGVGGGPKCHSRLDIGEERVFWLVHYDAPIVLKVGATFAPVKLEQKLLTL